MCFPHANPKNLSFDGIHDDSSISMAFVHSEFVNHEMLNTTLIELTEQSLKLNFVVSFSGIPGYIAIANNIGNGKSQS